MGFPTDLKYTTDHEWIRFDGKKSAVIGITDYALEQLSDVVHLDLPEVGDTFESGSTFGTIESTKTVSDLYMPVSGKVVEINEDVLNNLEDLQDDPYGNGWLVKVKMEEESEEELMSAAEYEKFIAEQD